MLLLQHITAFVLFSKLKNILSLRVRIRRKRKQFIMKLELVCAHL